MATFDPVVRVVIVDPEVLLGPLTEAIVDAMIDYGPDGHCDGSREIACAALAAIEAEGFRIARLV